jgi:hypothetical protein
MSETTRRVLTSCMTIVLVICFFLSLLFIMGAGIILFGSQLGSL